MSKSDQPAYTVMVRKRDDGRIMDLSVEGMTLGKRLWMHIPESDFTRPGIRLEGDGEVGADVLSRLLDFHARWVQLGPTWLRWRAEPRFGSAANLAPIMGLLGRLPGCEVAYLPWFNTDMVAVDMMPSLTTLQANVPHNPAASPLTLVGSLTESGGKGIVLEARAIGIDDNGGRGEPHAELLVREADTENRWQLVRVRLKEGTHPGAPKPRFPYEIYN